MPSGRRQTVNHDLHRGRQASRSSSCRSACRSWRWSSQRAFIGTIIEYPVASILLQTEENLTLAVGSRLYLYEQNYLWGDFAAAAVLSGLPITVVFLVAQRWLVSGLTAGAVKG